ncbi:nitroreductase family deazaflavin-dependent oxidoreductase [Actinopolymorpha sp. B17G11]|uniref:nitroreductase family deazaflavin-dependent oxidoreductase n=1 Tax=unclassified Actinopolymorpha TaxID=2627063 RepID=UPI0032D932DA
MIDIAALAANRTIDLTTWGRRSGRPVRIEIWWFHVDGRLVVTGTPGPRHWYANVLANPAVIVHIEDRDLPGTARPITDRRLRHQVFIDVQTSWYLSQAPLEELIQSSPMIEIELG